MKNSMCFLFVLLVPLALADPPQGYYDSAQGLIGEPLRVALHDIIDSHTSLCYDSVWTAFYATDDRLDGFVWDIYSDTPGDTPPYLYTFGEDQGGSASGEGEGYNREHTWPKSWFYGDSSVPVYTDLHHVMPTDIYVNGRRSSYPYGEVADPSWTSMNGSFIGLNIYPGYSGTAFEPIDEYKGDIARNYFYITVRYYSEDIEWPDGPMSIRSQLLPWAVEMLMEWHMNDSVSTKEIDRNDEVYSYQNNRNPFIDHPEFVELIYNPTYTAGTEVQQPNKTICSNSPNPFSAYTEISFELPLQTNVSLRIYSISGHLIDTPVDNSLMAPGSHDIIWSGCDESGSTCKTGVYFYQLVTPETTITGRMMLVE